MSDDEEIIDLTIEDDVELEERADSARGTDDEQDEEERISRRDVLSSFIQSTVAALGGFVPAEDGDGGRVYEMGDSCLGCLRDLKKFWRKDDTDDERTVARIFWETRVLPNDLVPILLETAGKGAVLDKRAIACADLITAMTWPIDVAEELKELDEELDAKTDYTTLLQAQLAYKAALLQPGALKALLDIMKPSLAKTKRDRTDRDTQIINVVLHAFRNLAFIKDPPADPSKSSSRAEYSSLQSKMIMTMKETGILDIVTTLAANATDGLFNPFNTVLLEIYYLLLRGVKPRQLTLDPDKATQETLRGLLEVEAQGKQLARRETATRHSRFGTTIAIRSGKDQFVVHKQSGITADASTVMSRAKNNKAQPARKIKRQDELASFEQLGPKALAALQGLAVDFLESCFEAFFSSLLKDIKAERAKITESDNIRLMAVVKWFIEFFLAQRSKELAALSKGKDSSSNPPKYEDLRWRFEMVAEVVERNWVAWVLRRMRMAMDDKPKQWTEIRAGMDCLSQLLLLLDQMSLPESPEFAHEASQGLQHQLYYSGEILEISFDSLKGYKEQSIAYLDSTIHLAYLLLRMLERWAKTQGQMYVRKTKKTKAKTKKAGDENGVVDVGSDEEESRPGDSMWNEHMFTFEKYEAKFAQEDITRACLAYLERYREFENPEQMHRVVSLMHRQTVKVKAEGLYFKVTTLELFNRILDDEKVLPRDSARKELSQMINFLLRKFFKSVQENPFLVVEAFYPKNRGSWKQFSSYVPPVNEVAAREAQNLANAKAAVEVQIKKGYSDEEKLGIAIGVLLEQDKMPIVDWIRMSLMTVIALRLVIVNEVIRERDDQQTAAEPGTDEDAPKPSLPPVEEEALSRFEDYVIPYPKEEQAEAGTKDPYVKLTLRLIGCEVKEPDAEELEWFFPAAHAPEDLQKHLDVIARYLEEPIDLDGKNPSAFVQKKRAPRKTAARRSRRRAASSGSEDEQAAQSSADEGEIVLKKRKKKRAKEEVIYKSHEFIEDSDFDAEADAAFMAKEEEIRKRNAAAIQEGLSVMQATGTKKRKRGKNDATSSKDPAADDREILALPGSASPQSTPAASRTASKKKGGAVKPTRRKTKASKRSPSVNLGSDDNRDGGDSPSRSSSRASAVGSDHESVPINRPRPRPRPRPRFAPSSPAATTASPASSPAPGTEFGASSGHEDEEVLPSPRVAGNARKSTSLESAAASHRGSASPGGDGDRDEDDDLPVRLTQPRAAPKRRALVLSDDEE